MYYMGALMFYIPQDIIQEVLKLSNRSEVVTNFLREYFEKEKPKFELQQKMVQQSLNLMNKADILALEIKQEEQQKLMEEEQEEHLKILERKEKEADLKQKRGAIQKELFLRNWEIKKEEAGNLAEEYLLLYDSGKVKNTIEYMELKGFKRKEEKEGKNGQS